MTHFLIATVIPLAIKRYLRMVIHLIFNIVCWFITICIVVGLLMMIVETFHLIRDDGKNLI